MSWHLDSHFGLGGARTAVAAAAAVLQFNSNIIR